MRHTNLFFLLFSASVLLSACSSSDESKSNSNADANQCVTNPKAKAGESFLSSDGCNQCFCNEDGTASCSRNTCE